VNIIFIPRYGYWACAWGGVAGYGTAMMLSYFVGQKKNPIPYPIKDIAIYFIAAMAAFGLMECFAIYMALPTWTTLIVNNILILGFVGIIIRSDMPLSSLPIIGKKFKK
jgi:O-antigen/teichoic acid export membrane protein